MTIPTFTTAPGPAAAVDTSLTRHAAAAELDMTYDQLTKLIKAGLVAEPISRELIASLARRPTLRATSGELPVLRTDAWSPAPVGDPRKRIGYHLSYDDGQLAETSLRWWRSDPARITAAGMLVVTIASFPVALYSIIDSVAPIGRGPERRQGYVGDLLARLHHCSIPTPEHEQSLFSSPVEVSYAVACIDSSHPLMEATRQIMTSRIFVSAGGPIGYLASA